MKLELELKGYGTEVCASEEAKGLYAGWLQQVTPRE
jgi:hypothetical protein